MLDKNKVKTKIYEEATETLVKFGVKLLLKSIGFNVVEYPNTTKVHIAAETFNYELFTDFIGSVEYKKLETNFKRRLVYNIKTNLISTLENSEVITNTKQIAIDAIISYAVERLRTQAYGNLINKYADAIETEILSELPEDIKESLIKRL